MFDLGKKKQSNESTHLFFRIKKKFKNLHDWWLVSKPNPYNLINASTVLELSPANTFLG